MAKYEVSVIRTSMLVDYDVTVEDPAQAIPLVMERLQTGYYSEILWEPSSKPQINLEGMNGASTDFTEIRQKFVQQAAVEYVKSVVRSVDDHETAFALAKVLSDAMLAEAVAKELKYIEKLAKAEKK